MQQTGIPRGATPPSLSPPAIAPVGLEVTAEAQATGSIRLPLKRRRLRGIVIGTLGGCTLILVAAVIARVSHASSEPRPVPAIAKVQPAAPPAVDTTAAPTPDSTPAPTTGTLRLERPAAWAPAWLDGKKLASNPAVVSCGDHQLKLGLRSRAKSVRIPCGAELVVSK